ncbi:hypothetical protein ACPCTO_32060 [Streptomyces olivoreticuli]
MKPTMRLAAGHSLLLTQGRNGAGFGWLAQLSKNDLGRENG